MLITSHLVVTLLAAKGLALEGPELLVALAGGVALDADHLFTNIKWASDIKNLLREGRITHGEIKQHSWIQELVSGLISGAIIGFLISLVFPQVHWWIFPLFQATHIFLDSLMKYEHQPFVPFSRWRYRGFVYPGSRTEWLISSLILIAVVT